MLSPSSSSSSLDADNGVTGVLGVLGVFGVVGDDGVLGEANPNEVAGRGGVAVSFVPDADADLPLGVGVMCCCCVVVALAATDSLISCKERRLAPCVRHHSITSPIIIPTSPFKFMFVFITFTR